MQLSLEELDKTDPRVVELERLKKEKRYKISEICPSESARKRAQEPSTDWSFARKKLGLK